jgi:hypothetical protein
MNETQSDYDGAWKEALERYFAEFMDFFFPQAHTAIDWSKGYEFLDKELQQVARDAQLGQRRADKLVKVWQKNGDETWVLVHVEVQSQEETGFAERMYVYNYRLFDRYHRRVASLAVLGDERAGWRPNQFAHELWGCRVRFEFPMVKLLDYQEEWTRLEEGENPFATVVMAHLKAQETRHDEKRRKEWKFYLTRRLYERGYGREDVLNLFRFIDWTLSLPEEMEKAFWQEMREYEEAEQMTYITSVEQIGIEKGIQQGIQQGIREGLLAGIELGLELKFGSAGLRLLPEIYKIEDVDVLRATHEGLKVVTSVEELRLIYQSA